MQYLVLALGGVSLVISWLLTALMIRVAPRIGFVDKPGHRKIHAKPKPLGGGVAIFVAFALPLIAIMLAIRLNLVPTNHPDWPAYAGGVAQETPLVITLLLGLLGMHILGLIDDRKALGAYPKLIVQLVAATVLATVFSKVRILTIVGTIPSILLTVLWITAITNAFNFLDNMDGLSAGVGAVCATAFMISALLTRQWFVAGSLALLVGSVLGFLFWNLPPAKIFMGDSGSLVIGFLLAVLSIGNTYVRPNINSDAAWYAVLAPIIVLAVPLYDLIVVSIIRISRGKSPFVGDTNHFSHRLVARGMSRRTAVLCIYLVTAETALAAILLPFVQSTLEAVLIFCQTILMLCVVALLEQHPLPASDETRR